MSKKPGAVHIDFDVEVAAKEVELLHAVVPTATRFAVFVSDNPLNRPQIKALEEAARAIGLTLTPELVRSEEDFDEAFASVALKKVGALIVLGGPPFGTQVGMRKPIALATKSKIPTMYQNRWRVDLGGLMSYGPNFSEIFRLGASYVDRILKGAKPADLPVQRPTKFELVINLKTAKALGVTIPPSLLLRADQVIE